MLLKWVVLLPLSLAAICPLERHQVCNIVDKDDDGSEQNKHRCTCAITALSDRPPPEQSCSNFIKIDEEDGTFPVTSITFNLKESPDLDEFPEESFRDTIAAALRVDQANILILRVNCMGTEDSLTVQFAVLKPRSVVESKKKTGKKSKKNNKDDDEEEDEEDKADADDGDDEEDDDDGGDADEAKDDGNDEDDEVEDAKATKTPRKSKGQKESKNNAREDDDDDDDDEEDEQEKNDGDDDDDADHGDGDDDDDADDDDEQQVKKRKKFRKGKIDEDEEDENSKDEDDDDEDDEEEEENHTSEYFKYDTDMFVDAESVTTRMKAMGHLSQIADLQVDSIQFTEDIIDVEFNPDNSTLFIQATSAGVLFLLMFILGVFVLCRKREYSDDLQKA